MNTINSLINIDKSRFIGLSPASFSYKVANDMCDIVNCSLTDNVFHRLDLSLNTVRQAYDNLCKYVVNLYKVIDEVTKNTETLNQVYYDFTICKQWDKCFTDIQKEFESHKTYLLNLYKQLSTSYSVYC